MAYHDSCGGVLERLYLTIRVRRFSGDGACSLECPGAIDVWKGDKSFRECISQVGMNFVTKSVRLGIPHVFENPCHFCG